MEFQRIDRQRRKSGSANSSDGGLKDAARVCGGRYRLWVWNRPGDVGCAYSNDGEWAGVFWDDLPTDAAGAFRVT